MMDLKKSLVCVAVLLTLATSQSDGPCPSEASGGTQIELACFLPSGTEIELDWRARKYVTLECDGKGSFACAELPKVSPKSAPPTRAMLKNCDLPVNESLACTLQTLGAPIATSLTLRGIAAKHLTLDHVHGLVNLSTLTLVGSSVTHLPTAALSALPALRRLTVREASLHLTSDSLLGVSGLEYLELSASDIKQLNASFFRGQESLHTLSLWGNELRALQSGIFEGLDELDTLDLSSNPLQSLGDGVLEAAKNLRVLRLVDTELSQLDEPSLHNLNSLEELMILDGRKPLKIGSRSLALPKLRLIELERCKISVLPGDALSGARSLRTLSLSHNALESLPSELLRDSTELRALNLSHNALKSLTPALFQPLWHLEELNLDNNQLEEFSDDMFETLGVLRSLSARNNRLRTLSPTAFRGARSLQYLDLSHNELTLRSADTIETPIDGYMDFTDGRSSPMAELIAMQYLDLGHNQIQDVFYDWRNVMLNLKLLNLTNNRIEFLENPDINFLSIDAIVDFRYNQITTIQVSERELEARADDGESYAGSGRLLVDGNPFNCDCFTFSLLRFLNSPSYEHIFPVLTIDDAICASPPALANITVRAVPLAKLTCELPPPKCPDNCNCTLHPAEQAIKIDCMEPPLNVPAPYEFGFGLNRTVLRLQNAPPSLNISLPVHELVLSGLNLKAPPPGPAPPELKLLDLTNNLLTEVPPASGYKLRLARNPIACDCAHSDDLVALHKSTDRVWDYNITTCAHGGLLQLNSDANLLCARTKAAWAAGIGGTLALLGVLATVLAVLWLRYQNEIKVYLFARGWCGCLTRSGKEAPAKYDAFLSFSHKDEETVVHKLIPELERRGYRLCVHYRDWAPGESIAEHVSRSVLEARRTLVVASPGFLSSEWARAEFRAAHARALREGRARVIVILLGELPAPDPNAQEDDLRTYLRTNTYLKWGDPWFWQKLQYALPHRPLGDLKEVLPLPPGTISADALRAALAVHIEPKDKLSNGFQPRLLPPPAL
ncbi:protein toll-like [Leguminivora glycinivorella]|uniref:protein toll-like n=1 Tax=Leguminivora glycinivorella TaxID=1035111 RepID=UPI00200E1631|nr:protein toll-like [Leguminivora glycinivorella]